MRNDAEKEKRGDNMTTCPKCGEEIKNEQTNHCPNCGATINDNGENSSNQASNEATIRLKKIVPWAIGGFIIILLIIVFVLLKILTLQMHKRKY